MFRKSPDSNQEKNMTLDTRRRLWHMFLTATSFSGISYLFMFHKSFLSWFTSWLHWCPTTPGLLEQAEQKILSTLKKSADLLFIRIPSFDQVKEDYNIRTLIIKEESNASTPLVLLHGFASGIGLWILNLDSLSENRTVYAFDLLGFGRSSRPQFSKDAELVEQQFVESIEQWRKQAQLDRFILLGHSMGGFLAASYAIKYPEKVAHLILADPWGFPECDLSEKKIQLPVWVKVIGAMLRPFNPLAGLRAVGPWGPGIVKRFRPDILNKFENCVEDTSVVSDYIYHCNAQTPSGEAAFKAMTLQFGWAKRPMLKRINELRPDISITFIYGSRSWVDSNSGVQAAALRPNSHVEVKLIQGAGHHVYADRDGQFNKLVSSICKKVDEGYYIQGYLSQLSSKIDSSKSKDHKDKESDSDSGDTSHYEATL